LCCLDGPVDGSRPKFQQALQSACLFDDYAARIDFQDSRTLVGSACYPAYPLCRMESPELVVWLDGRIYGIAESRLQSELLSLGEEVFRKWGSRQDRLGSSMLSVIPSTGAVPRPQGFVHYPTLLDCLRKQAEESPIVRNTLSEPVLGEILAHPDQYNGEAIGLLITITSMLEYVSGGTSSILSFADSILDSYT
jgi:hypothetical protein